VYTMDKVEFMKGNPEIFTGQRDPISRLLIRLFTRSIAPALPNVPAMSTAAIVVPAPALATPAVRLQSKKEYASAQRFPDGAWPDSGRCKETSAQHRQHSAGPPRRNPQKYQFDASQAAYSNNHCATGHLDLGERSH
jgi:hypothetical protein